MLEKLKKFLKLENVSYNLFPEVFVLKEEGGDKFILFGDDVSVAELMLNLRLALDADEILLFACNVRGKPTDAVIYTLLSTPLIKAWSYFHGIKYVPKEFLDEILFGRVKRTEFLLKNFNEERSTELDKASLAFEHFTDVLCLLAMGYTIKLTGDSPINISALKVYYEYTFKEPSLENVNELLRSFEAPFEVGKEGDVLVLKEVQV